MARHSVRSEGRLKFFGRQLYLLRKGAQLSQREFAERIGGESSQNISRLEKGERAPSLETLLQLVEAFDVSLDEMLGLGHGMHNTVNGAQYFCAWGNGVVNVIVPEGEAGAKVIERLVETSGAASERPSDARGFNAD